MSREYSEDNLVEAAVRQGLEDLGWQVEYAWHKETFGEHGLLGREDKSEVILRRHLLQALKDLNPNLPHAAYQDAIDQITEKAADKKPVQISKEKHTLFTKGVDVSFTDHKGELVRRKLKVFDFDTLSKEDNRAMREGLDEETLAIFDLLKLKKEALTPEEIKEVKKVSKQTLKTLKAEKLKVKRWRESPQLKAQVRTAIYERLLWLPQKPYSDNDVDEKTKAVYQHVFTNYYGGGRSVYSERVA